MKVTELTTAVALTAGAVVVDERHLPLNPAMALESDFGPLIRFSEGETVVVSSNKIRKCLINLADSYRQEALKTQHSEDGRESLDMPPSIPDDLQITETLLEYLCRDDLIGPVEHALRVVGPFLQPQGPLFELVLYAVKFWPAHYRSAEGHHGVDSQGINRVLKLLQDRRLARIWPTLNDKVNRVFSPPDVCLLDPFLLYAELGLTTIVERLQTTVGATLRQAAMNAASWGGNDHIVGILLRGAQTHNDPPWDVSKALEYASASGHDKVIDRLLRYWRSTAGSKLSSLDRLVCQAARLGYAKQVLLFCQAGGDAKVASEGMTPLQYAAESGHSSVVELLLEEGRSDVDLEGHGSRMATPLMLAAENGHKSVVEILLRSGVYTNRGLSSEDDGILTPLRLAAKAGQTETVEILLKHAKKSDGNKKLSISNLLRDPLLVAVEQGHVEIVEQLLRSGADAAATDDKGHTPLYQALERGHGVLAGKILEHKVAWQPEGSQGHLSPILRQWSMQDLPLVSCTKSGAQEPPWQAR
jgi:ankyrin repeat protein